ncbi:MAG: hypothetical protein ACREBB_10170 [Nitrosotalea sp.]
MTVKEKVLPFLNSIVLSYLTVETALRGDLPSSIANGLSLLDSIKNVVNKRMYGFTISVAQLSEEIEKYQIRFIESLPQNEKFISVYTSGLFIAARNHQKEKLDMLRNAVLNTALSNTIDEDLQLSFISYIDRLTPSHIVALKAHSDYWNKHNIDITEIGNRYASYLDELVGLGLLLRPDTSPESMRISFGSRTCVITSKGEQFLDFIKSPLEKIIKS